ncbi:MAG: thermonuclease family protein [Acetobacteraceae bacterium]
MAGIVPAPGGLAARQPALRARRRLALAALLAAALGAAPAAAKGDAFAPPPAAGTPGLIRGPAEVIDGDTIDIRGHRIRLHGIEAPESNQYCTRGGRRWDCFEASAQALERLIGRAEVVCVPVGASFNRWVARCWVGGAELGGWMVWTGWAVVSERYNRVPEYRRFEAEARAERRGLWSSRFIPPEDWRAGRRR